MANAKAIAKRLSKNLRWILTGLLLAGWTAGWGLVALVGWAAHSSGIMYAGLTMMGAGLVGVGGGYLVARGRLRARAERSLIARAELRRLTLSDGMAARLHLFDDAWFQMQLSLGDPALPHADRTAELHAQLSEAQDELFRLAERHSAVREDLRQLGLYSASELIERTRAEKLTELERLDAAAEGLVKETRALASTADEVRALASGRSTEATDRLKEAVSQFNLTLSAYREVEREIAASSTDVERAKRLAKSQGRQGQEA